MIRRHIVDMALVAACGWGLVFTYLAASEKAAEAKARPAATVVVPHFRIGMK